MPRGRRKAPLTADQLQQELDALKQREAELKALLRQQRGTGRGSGALRRLQERLEGQFARAKWYAGEIKQLDPSWDEMGFYRSVQAQKPKPRGPRRKQAEAAG